MMKRCFLLLGLSLMLCGCAGLDQREYIHNLTEKDANKAIIMPLGDYLHITLPANPTTGYLWTYRIEVSRNVLAVCKDQFVPPPNDGRAGVPGYHEYLLRGVQPGEAHFVVTYARPWENNAPPAAKYLYTIIVK